MVEKSNKLIDSDLILSLKNKFSDLNNEISKVIVGQEDVIRQIMVSILSRGHCLLIGVPGLAKTLIVKSLADLMDLKFSRIQFTPDLMPSDITGTEIFDSEQNGGKRFKFIKGPVFANMILADEINRTPPKTQSALLEAMQENKVTAAGISYQLDQPFFVLATQNPIEHEGTYPLPEAQLDRFMFNILLDYTSFDDEIEIVRKTTSGYIPELSKVFSKEELLTFQELIRKIPVSDEVLNYTVKIVSKSRPGYNGSPNYIKDYINWGAGPRASQNLILGAKALTAIEGRFSPSIEDIIKVAGPVLRHRIILNFNAEADNVKTEEIISRLLEN